MTNPAVTAQDVASWRDLLLGTTVPVDEADTVELLGTLEALKSAICAVQADAAVGLDQAVCAREARAGVPAPRRGRGVVGQLGLARHESPDRAQKLLALARDLHTDLPHTRRALADGRLNERRAMVVARESSCLGHDDRQRLDADLQVEGLGAVQLGAEVRRRAQAADPASATRRARTAADDRHVSIRPAADATAHLTALLPAAEGQAAFMTLTRDAAALRAAGDPRSKGQLMADLLVERLTGQSTATAVPVCIDLVLSDETLLAAGHDPADLPGHGPIPAQIARELVAASLDGETPTWLRRLYADPAGALVATTSKQRFAPDGLADHVRLRDAGICRTPWCDAPVRHLDHVEAVEHGGETAEPNLQGLCEQCNYVKQAPGWAQRVVLGERHTVEIAAPAGLRHRSRAPALAEPVRRDRTRYRVDIVVPAA